MRFFSLIATTLQVSALALGTAAVNRPNSTTTLLVNAIVGKQNASSVECWAVEPGFQISPQTGNNILQLGSLSSASYSVWPNAGGPIDLGFHNAPAIQWVVMLMGGGNITFPDPTTPNLTVSPGELFIAADVAGTSTDGHRTVGDSGSVALQMPFEEGAIVNHTILSYSPCN